MLINSRFSFFVFTDTSLAEPKSLLSTRQMIVKQLIIVKRRRLIGFLKEIIIKMFQVVLLFYKQVEMSPKCFAIIQN